MLEPGVVRTLATAPYYSPAKGRWGHWWQRGACLLLLVEQIVLTEPLGIAMLSERQREPPRGTPNAVREALGTLLALRELVESGVAYWVPGTVQYGTYTLEIKHSLNARDYARLERKPRSGNQELWNALDEAEFCRQIGNVMPTVRGQLTRHELQQVQRVLMPPTGTGSSVADLLSLDVPPLAMTLTDLAGLRNTTESFADFRAGLTSSLRRIPAEIREDERWQEEASLLLSEALHPSILAVKKDLAKASLSTAVRVAGESVVFSVAGMGAGAIAGGMATPAAVISAAVAAAARAAREALGSRKKRASQKEHLKVLQSLTREMSSGAATGASLPESEAPPN